MRNYTKVMKKSPFYSPLPTAHGLRSASAFSLVEVTLALMVLAIGVLGIMSLFPTGLEQNARSVADTRVAFFAEEVFAGLQAKAETTQLEDEFNVPVSVCDMWGATPPSNLRITGTNLVVTNRYEYATYEDHVLRYRLVLTTNNLLKTATLYVWPGEYGGTNDPSLFYTEFFRFRPL